MQIMGLKPFYPHKGTSMPDKQHKKYPYLLKDMLICRPNQVWAADITYIRLAKGFCYLVAIIDWYSKYILSYRISTTLDASFCVDALREALGKYPTPEISNTDQGGQFTGMDYTEILLSQEIKSLGHNRQKTTIRHYMWKRITSLTLLMVVQSLRKRFGAQALKISMDSKGRALDNVIIERFFRSLKHEDIYLKEYRCLAELKTGVAEYMFKYNHERLHEALDYRTPAEIYFARKEVVSTEEAGSQLRKLTLEIAV